MSRLLDDGSNALIRWSTNLYKDVGKFEKRRPLHVEFIDDDDDEFGDMTMSAYARRRHVRRNHVGYGENDEESDEEGRATTVPPDSTDLNKMESNTVKAADSTAEEGNNIKRSSVTIANPENANLPNATAQPTISTFETPSGNTSTNPTVNAPSQVTSTQPAISATQPVTTNPTISQPSISTQSKLTMPSTMKEASNVSPPKASAQTPIPSSLLEADLKHFNIKLG